MRSNARSARHTSLVELLASIVTRVVYCAVSETWASCCGGGGLADGVSYTFILIYTLILANAMAVCHRNAFIPS